MRIRVEIASEVLTESLVRLGEFVNRQMLDVVVSLSHVARYESEGVQVWVPTGTTSQAAPIIPAAPDAPMAAAESSASYEGRHRRIS